MYIIATCPSNCFESIIKRDLTTANLLIFWMFKPKQKFFKQEEEPISERSNTESEPVYSIEKILKKKILKGKPHYFVKWVGYSHSENTWEPIEHLDHLQEMIAEFQDQEAIPPRKTKKIEKLKGKAVRDKSKQKSQKEQLLLKAEELEQAKPVLKENKVDGKQKHQKQQGDQNQRAKDHQSPSEHVQESKMMDTSYEREKQALGNKQSARLKPRVQVRARVEPQELHEKESPSLNSAQKFMKQFFEDPVLPPNDVSLEIQMHPQTPLLKTPNSSMNKQRGSLHKNSKSIHEKSSQPKEDLASNSESSLLIDDSESDQSQVKPSHYTSPDVQNIKILMALLGNRECSYLNIRDCNVKQSQKMLQQPGMRVSSIQNILCEVKLYDENSNQQYVQCLVPFNTLLYEAPRLLDNRLGQLVQVFNRVRNQEKESTE